jgi:hypothetical protein
MIDIVSDYLPKILLKERLLATVVMRERTDSGVRAENPQGY